MAMARLENFEVPYDSGQFTWLQLQPKSILSLCWSGYARWLRANLVSFPRLIREEGYGAVILDIDIRYLEPLTFFDGDTLEVSIGLKARRRGSRLQLDANFHGDGRHAATATIILCPVRIEDQETLTASPAPLSSRLMALFEQDEIDDSSPKRQIPDLVEAIEREGELLGERSGDFHIHHHYCEVAEQWSFIEVPNIVESLREPLALEQAPTQPLFRQCLNNPLKRINVELYQPYFVYDSGAVATSAYRMGEKLSFIHRLTSEGVGEALHGLVVERY
jgi:acyl-CoA thioesterase FadM